MRIATIVGARPQFIKAWAVSRVLRERHRELLIHTGQHYDEGLSTVFFDELGIPAPDYQLEIGSGSHGVQTAGMLRSIEAILVSEEPDCVLVYGDTNSTLAGVLAAAKLNIPIAHVEAGLRSWNRCMPEEINRVVADNLSSLLFCPSDLAVGNLHKEGISKGVHNVGDVMQDAFLLARSLRGADSNVLSRFGLREFEYFLATVHRAANADNPGRLGAILEALAGLDGKVVLPAHPRVRGKVLRWLNERTISTGIEPVEPVGYLDMSALLCGAKALLTDSGGLQKEAYWAGCPCITLRDETEWTETVDMGWNVLAGADTERILASVAGFTPPSRRPRLYGDGHASERIVTLLAKCTT